MATYASQPNQKKIKNRKAASWQSPTKMALLSWLFSSLFLPAVALASENLVFGDDPRKPASIDAALICHSCHATLAESLKKLVRLLLLLSMVFCLLCARWFATDTTVWVKAGRIRYLRRARLDLQPRKLSRL